MRISTSQIYMQSLAGMQRHQAELTRTEMQITSGLRIMKPSDDPSGSIRVLNLDANLATLEQYGRNADFAEASLAQQEQVLQDVSTALQRVRELTVQGNNATYSDRDRRSIALELAQRFDELLGLANTRDPNGEYIFGGNQVESAPFRKQGDAVVYQGDEGQRKLLIGEGAQVAVRDAGRDIFQTIPEGDGDLLVRLGANNEGSLTVGAWGAQADWDGGSYTLSFAPDADGVMTWTATDDASNTVGSGSYVSGEAINVAGLQVSLTGAPADGDSVTLDPAGTTDLFSLVRSIEKALLSPASAPADKARLHSDLGLGLAQLDQALDHLSNRRAEVGARLSTIDTMRETNEDFTLQLETVRSETQDLDYAEAISRFNLQLTSLQAAQQVFVKASGLSLFNYL